MAYDQGVLRAGGAGVRHHSGAVRVRVHRLRRRYVQLLSEQIRQTVTSPEEVKEEIRHRFAGIGS